MHLSILHLTGFVDPFPAYDLTEEGLTYTTRLATFSGMQQHTVVPATTPAPESFTDIGLRLLRTQVEEVVTENHAAPEHPALQAVVAAVIANPWAGTDATTDLSAHVERVAPVLATALTDRLVAALGGAEKVEAFGKGALVGTSGELEHAAALIHTPWFGNLVRTYLEGESIINFADGRAAAGETITVPLWHKTAAATRSHYQTVRFRIPDAPRAGEILVLAAASTGPRPHPRIGDRTTDPTVVAKEK